jgi:hypothetical protein
MMRRSGSATCQLHANAIVGTLCKKAVSGKIRQTKKHSSIGGVDNQQHKSPYRLMTNNIKTQFVTQARNRRKVEKAAFYKDLVAKFEFSHRNISRHALFWPHVRCV